jgi:hypothetical protein
MFKAMKMKKSITMKLLILYVLLLFSNKLFSQLNNYSIGFDGIDDYIEYGNSISVPNFPISIQADVKLPVNFQSVPEFTLFKSDESSGAYAGFWCAVKPTYIELSYGDGNGEGSQYRRSISAPHRILPKTWTNIACVINGPNDMTVYVDGIDVGGTYSGSGGGYMPSLGNIAVSSYWLSSLDNGYSEGKIDNLSIWDFELS